ncbi:MAG: recombinase family protein [Clostridiales bacterium]|nr:recombinase family protein [Clostridiales bacterium]
MRISPPSSANERNATSMLRYMPNEMILTFLMSQAQSESESMSSNIRWGHQARFKQGIVHYNYKNFLGYRKGSDGEPEIDENEAPTVRRIFARYLMGQSVGQICKDLTADGLKTARGGTDWSDHTVRHILQNEKYMGDAILQKTFTLDLFSRQQVKNEGQLPKYYVENAHPAIIDRDTFQRVQEEMARRSSLRKTSSKAKTEQGKHSGKYVLSGLLVCSECGSPYRRVTYMPGGQKRFVWRCINRLEHGKRICKHAPTLEEPEVQAAVTAAMNEMFRHQTARQTLADCIAAALAGTGDDVSLPAVEAKLRALQEEQMRLFHLAADAGPENTEYDDRLIEVSTAIAALLTRKGELEQEGIGTECDSRVRFITDALETTGSAIEGFDEGMVCQTVASITVLDAERLSIRFKDGTEIEQIIECVGRASA